MQMNSVAVPIGKFSVTVEFYLFKCICALHHSLFPRKYILVLVNCLYNTGKYKDE